jgi:multiple sugar transport system substrate-binding protein
MLSCSGRRRDPGSAVSSTGFTRSLLLALLLLPVSSCDRTERDSSGKIPVVVAYYSGAKDRVIFRRAADDFMAAHPAIEVKLLEIPGNYYQKLLVLIAGGNAPDLMWMGQGFTEFAHRGIFLDVTDRIARDIDVSAFTPQALSWYQLDGRSYGMAYGFDLKFLVINGKLFDDAGVTRPRDGWTFDEFLAAAKALTKDTDGDGRIDQYGFSGNVDPSTFGAAILSADAQRATCDEPNMLRFLRTNLDLAERYRVCPSGKQQPNEAFDDVVTIFRQGRIAMMTMSTWNLPFVREQCADMDWDIANNPIVDRPGHWGSSQAMLISSTTRHPDQAWLVFKSFIEGRFQREMSSLIVPTRKAAAQEMVERSGGKPPHLARLLDATRSMQRRPQIADLNEVWQRWLDGCESVWSLRASPEQAMAQVQRDIQKLITDRKRWEQ